MPRSYPKKFRSEVCERLVSGESVDSLAIEFSVSTSTLYLWRKQTLIDHDLLPGAKSFDVDELAQARRRIQELELELEITRAAAALFNGEEPISPKGGARLPKP